MAATCEQASGGGGGAKARGGRFVFKAPLARLIQSGFTGEAKAGEARKTGFSRLLVHFNPGLQNSFTLQCLDLRKIDEAEAGISRAKEALNVHRLT